MWWPKCLTYGNWGGPGWSGGVFNNDPAKTDWTVPSIDHMDEAFKQHDLMYQRGMSRCNADRILCAKLEYINPKGIWANIYKIGAKVIFGIRSFFGKG